MVVVVGCDVVVGGGGSVVVVVGCDVGVGGGDSVVVVVGCDVVVVVTSSVVDVTVRSVVVVLSTVTEVVGNAAAVVVGSPPAQPASNKDTQNPTTATVLALGVCFTSSFRFCLADSRPFLTKDLGMASTCGFGGTVLTLDVR